MSLYKRLHDVQAAPLAGTERRDPLQVELKTRIHQQLIEELGPTMHNNTMTEEQLERRVRDLLQGVLVRERAPLSSTDRTRLVQEITDDVIGYGPIDKLLKDESVSDILVNRPDSVYVEKSGRLEKSDVVFNDVAHVKRIIEKIVSQVGRRIDEASPMCDARLPDGSRVNAMIHPLAVNGPFLTIRKFGTERLKIDDLLRFETLTPVSARFLQACTVGRLNIVVAGSSGSGKTTMLNVMSSFIPADERIITVEDAKELSLGQDHVLALEARPANVDGKGEITIRDLVKNTLRMRPDRIIVGECRSGEALDMLQAMNTGHDGSVTTVHANAPRDALSRLETLVLMSGFDLPVRAIREQMSAALDLVVQMGRLRDGSRRITQITEVQGMEGDTITLQDIFVFDHSMGVDEDGKVRGRLKATGVKPKFAEKLADHGIKLPKEIFEKEATQKALKSASDADAKKKESAASRSAPKPTPSGAGDGVEAKAGAEIAESPKAPAEAGATAEASPAKPPDEPIVMPEATPAPASASTADAAGQPAS